MSRSDKLEILFLADDRHTALALLDHINVFPAYSRHNWHIVNPTGESYATFIDLEAFDAVAIHYSLLVLYDWYLPAGLRRKLTRFRGLKIQFIQDEYRWVNQISRRMAELGIDLLFTLVRPELVDKAYGHRDLNGIRKVSVLPGYVPNRLINHPVKPIAERDLHIAYRGRRLPFWLGELGQDKARIAEGVSKLAPAYGLSCDISVREEDRIYGEAWLQFLGSAKAVLGTEGGSSIWDFESEAYEKVEEYLKHKPEAEFAEVSREVLAPYEGNLMYNTVSPRLFEGIALKTAMVMFPGWYNGIVQPDRHYIPLQKDFSNIGEVAEKLRDDRFLQDLVDRAYDEIVRPGKYSERAFVALVDRAVDELWESKQYWLAVIARRVRCVAAQRGAGVVHRAQEKSERAAQRAARALRRAERRHAWLMPILRLKQIRDVPARVIRLTSTRRYSAREKIYIVVQQSFSMLPDFLRHMMIRTLQAVLPAARFARLKVSYQRLLRKRGGVV
jgi:hypothetical protein